ncbi:MAG: hypothetical protein ABF289_18490 [Clostridiales bacterium]
MKMSILNNSNKLLRIILKILMVFNDLILELILKFNPELEDKIDEFLELNISKSKFDVMEFQESNLKLLTEYIIWITGSTICGIFLLLIFITFTCLNILKLTPIFRIINSTYYYFVEIVSIVCAIIVILIIIRCIHGGMLEVTKGIDLMNQIAYEKFVVSEFKDLLK